MTPQAQRLTEANVKTKRRINWRGQATAYLFLAPALLLFALVTWYPILNTIIYSFQKVNLAAPPTWVGFNNYTRMFGDPLFVTAWVNALSFALLSILMGFMVPVVLALMINELRRLAGIFQTIVYLPTLIPVAVALLVWRQLYAPEGGILNSLLGLVGVPPQLWLQSTALVKPAMVIIMTWLGAGATVLIYISALKEIPLDIYEAAELDGFTPLQRIRHIALPLISSRMQIMLVFQVILVAQVFTEPFILTSGGPANSSLTPVLQIYRTAFDRNDIGLASAWSVSMLVVLGIFSMFYVWLIRRRDEIGKL